MRHGMLRKWTRRRTTVGGGIVLVLVFSLLATATPDTGDGLCRIGTVLEPLGGLLSMLDESVAKLDRPGAERLSEALEAVEDELDELLAASDASCVSPDTGGDWRLRLARLDRHLHRMLSLVEDVVTSVARTAAQERAEERIEELRVWLDSVVFDASDGMSAEEYEQLESAVYQTARRLGLHMMQMADPDDPTPVLTRLLERLHEQVRRLDRLLLGTR